MFELLDDRTQIEVKWWTLPSFAFCWLGMGLSAGLMIGRRNTDPLEWGQFVLWLLLIWRIYAPFLRKINDALRHKDNRAH
jgi:hypothetical protein